MKKEISKESCNIYNITQMLNNINPDV